MARLARALLLYALATAAIALLHSHAVALSLALLAVLLVTLRVDPERGDVWFPVGGFMFGPLTEIAAVARGGWEYARPDFLGIPLWLPFGWAAAALLLRRLAEALLALRRA